VRLGEHDLTTYGSTEKNFQVDSIQIHERFLLANKINDIAVIKLKGTVTFTADIQPICLPQKHIPLDGSMALAAGLFIIFTGILCY
jgi:Trypsin